MTEEQTFKPQKHVAKAKADKIEVVRILILAIVSFLAGFALVFLFLRPPSSSIEDEVETASATPLPTEERVIEKPDSTSSSYASASESPSGANNELPPKDNTDVQKNDSPPVSSVPEVPPGKTPLGVTKDGKAFYLKCWDKSGIEHKGAQCDNLEILEKRFSTRLYVVDKCRKEMAGETARGKLSVGAEVDFGASKISFWNGASSDVKNSAKIGTCLRESLSGLPVHGIEHKFDRYRLFFTVLFGNPSKKADPTTPTTTPGDKSSNFASGKGKLVDVTKDKVRVRRKPIDGEIVGKISSDSQVRLIKKKDGWCNIITPNNNNGWMICNALGI